MLSPSSEPHGDPTMMIDERTKNVSDTTELKVMIPEAYHDRLHSMKSDTGRLISQTVTEALNRYFDALRAAKASSN